MFVKFTLKVSEPFFKERSCGFWKNNSGDATCELQLINDLEEQAPTNSAPVIINPALMHRFHLPCKNPLGGLRHLLNNPDEILLDPLLYTDHENIYAANFARRIISGEFAG